MKISVVTPLYRSAPYIEQLYRRCIAAIAATGAETYEIIFVNDASPDDSLTIAKRVAAADSCVVVIDLARNFGQHKAVMTGLARTTGDYVFVMDSDLEDEPEWIRKFHEEIVAHGCDVVYGISNNKKGGWLYTHSRKAFYSVLNRLSGISFPPNVCSARLMSRRYADALLLFKESELFMAGIWHMAGFTQLPIEVIKHDTSPTSYSTSKLIGVFVNAVTAFSVRPLQFISIVGIGVSLGAVIYTLWIVYRKLVHDIAIEGWASVMAAVLTIGGLSLLFNGVIAIYIAKIFIEVKRRPRTIVKDVFQAEHSPHGSTSVELGRKRANVDA